MPSFPLPALPFLAACLLLVACQPPPDATLETAETGSRDSAGAAQRHYQCGEIVVGVSGDADADTLSLSLSGRRLMLARSAGDGGSHADGAGNRFQRQDGRASLVLSGERPRDCTPTDRESPWDQAAARGVIFRAVGQEPGWVAEVNGDPSRLTAQLDYGERGLQVEPAEPLPGQQTGFHGKSTHDEDVRLEIRREECADGMSGERFEARATLFVAGQRYEGCGAFLDASPGG